MVVVADINTIWRSRPFEALAELRPVLGLKPNDPFASYRSRGRLFGPSTDSAGALSTLRITLPFKWASAGATRALPKLWSSVRKHLSKSGQDPTALIVTSPHYSHLVEQVAGEFPTFYYCSDNYADYQGWDSTQMRKQEREIVLRACHSFFVSASLLERAQREYQAPDERLSISMNATDAEFLCPVGKNEIERLFRTYPKLKQPIVGVIGGVNAGLDYALLAKVAALKELGTLLVVGQVERQEDSELTRLLKQSRVLFVGRQPHNTLPVWMQMIDVAVIPYRQSGFNFFRSPMRLFDHLASGRPIVATNACPQVLDFAEHIGIASDNEDFLSKVVTAATSPLPSDQSNLLREQARLHTWLARARVLDEVISRTSVVPRTSS